MLIFLVLVLVLFVIIRYMTGVDIVLEVFIPFWIGPIVYNGHYLSVFIFSVIGAFNTLHSHSAYVFPGWPTPEDHFVHHNMYKKNYSLKVFDYLHDTYLSFLNYKGLKAAIST